ncbi:MAG: HmuY family protein [Candidatus Pseudobacter hemicellulosilyticus]|uniref:HmuY family protein n=1 Tax=Candidatus Pseudobacter hemicellulosilyticus TaxID=3121375 RepID=A0AAJ6BGJ2_9BACT|nr:MAG: HmuY family protein [Pseudobacter sp.]
MKYFLLILSLASLVACSKDGDKVEQVDLVSTTVLDLALDTLASMSDDVDGKEKRPFYTVTFNFKTRQTRFIKTTQDSLDYLPTDGWDIAFSKEYNSYVVANNGNTVGTPGYKGPGVGRMVVIEQPYEKVTEAPSEEVFTSEGVAGVGWDSGNGLGWFFYSLSNHICVPVKNRTFVVKTATGKFAKLQIMNIYKGNPPVVTDLFWPAPYVSFRYYVQEDGSRNLRTN